MSDLTTISFHGATLVALKGATPADTLVAMKPVVEGMGLTWEPQFTKLKTHPVLSKGVTEIVIPSAGGDQRATALPLSRLNFWLATIRPGKVTDPDVRSKVVEYQEECADVLFAHFFAKAGGDLPAKPDETIRRIDGINRMLAHKVTGMEKELSELTAAVRALVITHDPRIAAVDAVPALQVAIDAKVPKAGRRPIVKTISDSLSRHSAERGHIVRRDARGTKLFSVNAVNEWRLSGGDSLIRKLVAANHAIGPLFAIPGGKST